MEGAPPSPPPPLIPDTNLQDQSDAEEATDGEENVGQTTMQNDDNQGLYAMLLQRMANKFPAIQVPTGPPPPSALLTVWLTQDIQMKEYHANSFVPPQPEPDECFLLNNFHITEAVLEYLQPIDLCRCAIVCKALQGATETNELWQRLFSIAHSKPVTVPVEHLLSWKQCFRYATVYESLLAWSTRLDYNLLGKTALLIPHGTYKALDLDVFVPLPEMIKEAHRDNASVIPQPLIVVGVTGPQGEIVLFEDTARRSVMTLRLPNVILRNIHFRSSIGDEILAQAFNSIVVVQSGNAIFENCEFSARHKNVAGIYQFNDAQLTLKDCYLHDIPGTLLVCFSQRPITITDCRIVECGSILVQNAPLTIVDSVITSKTLERLIVCVRNTTVVTNCKITGTGPRACGVSVEGNAEVTKCDFTGIYCAVWKSGKGWLKVSECKISGTRNGSNCIQLNEPSEATIFKCDLRGASSAIEMEAGKDKSEDDNEDSPQSVNGQTFIAVESVQKQEEMEDADRVPRVVVKECKFIDNECGVLFTSKCDARVTDCVFENNDIGIRLENVRAQIERNSIAGSSSCAIHIDASEPVDPAVKAKWQSSNKFARNKEDVFVSDANVLPDDVGGAERTKLDRSVLVALSRKVCTFQVTGPHYKRQVVHRCFTCKLTEHRGMCAVCAVTCHAGHDVKTEAVQSFYCDCGAEHFCETLKKAQGRREDA